MNHEFPLHEAHVWLIVLIYNLMIMKRVIFLGPLVAYSVVQTEGSLCRRSGAKAATLAALTVSSSDILYVLLLGDSTGPPSARCFFAG